MLLFVIGLGGIQRHGSHRAHGTAHTVLTAGKNRIVELIAPAGQRLESFVLQRYTAAFGGIDGLHIFGPFFADPGQLTARNHGSFRVYHADGPISGLFELQHNVLKNSP